MYTLLGDYTIWSTTWKVNDTQLRESFLTHTTLVLGFVGWVALTLIVYARCPREGNKILLEVRQIPTFASKGQQAQDEAWSLV